MKPLFLLFFMLPFVCLAQHRITVNVEDVNNAKGKVCVAVYDSQEGFLKFDRVVKKQAEKAQQGTTQVIISDLPEGTYALAVFHDENANDELDTNWIGIPKEAVGFSHAKMKTFGPPKFDECAFKLQSDEHITIQIK